MKVAIMTDSNSGITQKEGKENHISILPMPVNINGQDYLEDINLTLEQFFDKLINDDADVFTSQPVIGDLTKQWDHLLKDYDQIVHIPMSSGLSGSCQTAIMVADDPKYKGKVFVVDSQRISVTQRCDAYDALALAKAGKTGQEIYDILMDNKMNATIYITVNTLTYLKKGGRITPAAAALGGLLKIKPILSIQGEKLDKCDTSRTLKKAKRIMIDRVKKNLKEKNMADNYHLYIAYTHDLNEALEFKTQVEEEFKHEVSVHPLSLSVSCHVGPGSLALAACKKITD